MGKKAAVLVGCNYPGTKAELKGCINDVNNIHDSLIHLYAFSPEDITVLIDTDQSYTQPTGANIRKSLARLVRNAEPGDLFFVHYSGHGTRLPAETGEDDDTGYDECIVPCDMNLITGERMMDSPKLTKPEFKEDLMLSCVCTDDDFREFVDKVPEGCKITIVSDSCHSSGLIDKAKEQIGESTKCNNKHQESSGFGFKDFLHKTVHDAFGSLGIHLSSGGHHRHHHEPDNEEGDEEHSEFGHVHVKSRFLPLSTLIEILKQKMGKDDIDVGKLRPTLFDMFGEDTCPKVKKFMKVLMGKLESGGGGGFMGMVGKLAQEFLKHKLEENDGDYTKPALETHVSSTHEVYARANYRSLPDMGILISGCQTHETSANAHPPGGSNKAYGAMSDMIQAILAETGDAITNRELVMKAREMLAKQGFKQHPGLYCSDDHADSPFIC